jgi:IclR family KDG regulon transcriptional repressor
MPSFVPASSRTMAMFEVFAREKRALSNSDVARALSLAESSCSDLLHTLHSMGYLMRTTRTRRFYPSGRLLETAREITRHDPLTAAAREAVEQLTDRTEETAFFGVMDRGSVKVAAAQPSRLPLRYILDVGERVSLHASALGKSLLGLLPRDEALQRLRSHALRPVTPETVTSVEQLMAQLDASRARGWYEARGEGTDGVTALAMSGWLGDQPVGISVAGPADRIERQHPICLQALREVRAVLLDEAPTTA